MTKPPKPFVFRLVESETTQVRAATPDSEGAITLHRAILDQLEDGNCIVTLNDAQLGQLIRHMARDGASFHENMFRAFSRSVYDLLAIHLNGPKLPS
jgi:hypothetical protein